MANRLATERSPYLRQHAENPVDWYPWGDEALDRARRDDRPILVSIGYSACHWCHVMAHESFEDPEIAALMNELLVNIKVDREERPDVDAIYMEAVQALTGQGGWPLNVFLTPDGHPFWGGTYFPADPRGGMPGWAQVVAAMARAYQDERESVLGNAAELTRYIRQAQQIIPGGPPLDAGMLDEAYVKLRAQFDEVEGGFGAAPKFPQPLAVELILRLDRRFPGQGGREFVELTLEHMGRGGIFDQLGGGFHRYSVDGSWTVPHFEKMLYDNALLAILYTHAFQLTGNDWYRSVAEETLDYLLRDLRAPVGGFYSAQDADSEGVEGKYYVWTPDEVRAALSREEAEAAVLRYGISEQGNFEGKTVLTVAQAVEPVAEDLGRTVGETRELLSRAKSGLLAMREQRVAPAKDTKILVGWNGLAIQALSLAGRAFGRAGYLRAARETAEFILENMYTGGRLMRSFHDGPGGVPAFLEDYASLIEALLVLYQTEDEERHLSTAEDLAGTMMDAFGDEAQGAFFDSPVGLPEPVARPRSFFDNPIASGNAGATFALLHLSALTGDSSYEKRALPALRAASPLFQRAPLGFTHMLSALDFELGPQRQIALVAGSGLEAMRAAVFARYLPNTVVSVGETGSSPLLVDRQALNGRATAYVCEHFNCQRPVTEPGELAAELED
ncbi:MAG: thioredoxin domain-containing protein [Chloroflexota bacterium]